MASKKIFGIVLAGGEGKRLMPLTADRAKPAVPFGGAYRLIDFALSNLINSGLTQIVVLTQYKSHSLDRHVAETWRLSGLLNSYVASVPAQQRLGKRWYLRQRRRDPPEPQPHQRRAARHRRRGRCRPRVPHGLQPDDRGAHRLRTGRRPSRRSASRSSSRTVRRDRPACARTRPGSRSSSRSRRTPRGCRLPRRGAGLDGQLRLRHPRPHRGARRRRRARRLQARHGRRHHARPSSSRATPGSTTSTATTCPGATDRDRYYWRDVGTIDSFFEAHRTSSRPAGVQPLQPPAGRSTRRQLNSPPAKLVRDAYGNNAA